MLYLNKAKALLDTNFGTISPKQMLYLNSSASAAASAKDEDFTKTDAVFKLQSLVIAQLLSLDFTKTDAVFKYQFLPLFTPFIYNFTKTDAVFKWG